MKNIHANDFDIQSFLFDQSACDPQMRKHIHSCKICKERVMSYQSLSSILKNQEEPKLEYDLAKLVMDQIPVSKSVKTSFDFLTNFIILTILGLTFTILMLIKETLPFLSNNTVYFQNYFIISIIGFISMLLVYDRFRIFYKRINLLSS